MKKSTYGILLSGMFLGVFLLDLLTPLGYAEWLLYLFPILLGAQIARRFSFFLFPAVSTLLTIAGRFVSPPGGSPFRDLVNRSLGILAFWIVAFILYRRKQTEDTLIQTDANLRVIFDSVHDAIFIHELDGKIINVNKKMLEIYGVTYEQALALSIRDDFSAQENPLDGLAGTWEEVISGRNQLFEWKARRPGDGSTFDAEVFLSEIVLDGKKVILATLRDISDRKKAERELRRAHEELELRVRERTAELEGAKRRLEIEIEEHKTAEKRMRAEQSFRKAIETSTLAGIVAVDTGGRQIYVNPAFCKMVGWEEDELVGKTPPFAYWPAEEMATIQKAFEETVSGKGRPDGYQLRFIRKSGEIFDALVLLSELTNGGDNRVGWLASIYDNTGSKTMERALRYANERLSGILSSITEAYFALDSEWRFVEINKEAERLYGSGLIGKVYWEQYPQHVGREFDRQYHLAVEEKHPVHFEEFSLVTNRWYEVHAYPRGDRLEVYFHDITDRKEAEEAIANLNRDLQRRAKELEIAYKDMESFSYAVSHDLKAPARRIRDFSGSVLEDYAERLDEPGKDMLKRMEVNAGSMVELIDDLLSFSRFTTAGVTKSEIGMGALAANVYEELKAGIGERSVIFEIGKMPPAYGDGSMIRQVLLNLLSNSLKFTRTRAPGRIEVGGYAEQDESIYYVRDNGIGFDMQFADKLFGLFQRIHLDNKFEGTGIGLVIVKRIVEKHGGRVWAEGKSGQGATFYFSLPPGPL